MARRVEGLGGYEASKGEGEVRWRGVSILKSKGNGLIHSMSMAAWLAGLEVALRRFRVMIEI